MTARPSSAAVGNTGAVCRVHAVAATVLLCIFAAVMPLSAAREQSKNRRVAVISFAANNTTPAIAGIVRNSVEINFFKDGGFDILEQSQIDIIIKERNLQAANCRDESCAVKLGELLQSDYVVIGSVDKLDKFTIHVKVVDVRSRKVIIAESQDADDPGALKPAAERLTRVVARRIREINKPGGARKPVIISAEFRYAIPAGYLAGIIRNGYGAVLQMRVEDLFVRHLYAGAGADFFYFEGRGSDVHHAMIVPLGLVLGYTLEFREFFPTNKTLDRVRPALVFRIGGGCSYSINNYYRDRIYRYPTVQRRGLLPSLGAGIALEFSIYGPLFFRTGVDYTGQFEKGGVLSLISLGGGISLRF